MYNAKVKTRVLLMSLLLVVPACNRTASESNDAVRAGIIEHLNKGAGLDLSQMDVQVSSVKFEGNTAKVAVNFRPKSAPEQGMIMNYSLESKDGKWVVIGKTGSGAAAGHGAGLGAPAPAAEPLPPGHPPVPQPK